RVRLDRLSRGAAMTAVVILRPRRAGQLLEVLVRRETLKGQRHSMHTDAGLVISTAPWEEVCVDRRSFVRLLAATPLLRQSSGQAAGQTSGQAAGQTN